MNRKKRLYSKDDLRNGLCGKVPGDKNFKYPECSKDFYKEGGLIPGSSFIRSKDKLVNTRCYFDTQDLRCNTLNPDKIFKNRSSKLQLETDLNYVKNLYRWDKEFINVKKQEAIVTNNAPINKNVKPQPNRNKK